MCVCVCVCMCVCMCVCVCVCVCIIQVLLFSDGLLGVQIAADTLY